VSEWEWAPLAPDEVAALLDDFPEQWWIAGGYALELFVGRPIREHADVDVAVLGSDQLALQRHLCDWDVQEAYLGRLSPWQKGERLVLPHHSVWARRDKDGPWHVQFLFDDDSGGVWHSRRDPSLTLPVAELGLINDAGLPYLRPEVVLHFKAKAPRERDEADFEAVLPALGDAARERLRAWLPAGHAWLDRL
jgi:hypothetical protein